MTAERKVIAKVRDLQQRVAAGDALGDRRAAAHHAVQDFDKETEAPIEQRRADRFRLYLAESRLSGIWSQACHARNDLAKLMRQHPHLLGDVSVLVTGTVRAPRAVLSA